MDELINTFIARGDLTHLALFLWATSASAGLVWALKELSASNRRFNEFVHEISSLNRLFRSGE